MSARTLLRARIVLPISRPPIEDGAVCVGDGLIHDVGTWNDLSARWEDYPCRDLGEVALMPGLVNAHCHLDYTNMAGKLPPPSPGNFPDWIKGMLALKAHWSYSEYAASWVAGTRQLEISGCTTVADIEAVPELLPDAWQATRLRVASFLEMTGVRSGHAPEMILESANATIARLSQNEWHWAGLSPHALYSTPPDLLRLVGERMRDQGVRVAMHLAESQAEFDMYLHGSGPLYQWLKNQRPMTDCGDRTPVEQAAQLGMLGPNLLAVHCNYLTANDMNLLAASRCTVVHCPQSHAYFQHTEFPYQALKRAGANIALGTDSLATTLGEHGKPPVLCMRQEMRKFVAKHPEVTPHEVLTMATQNGARGLGMAAGELTPGYFADLVAVDYSGRTEECAEFLAVGEAAKVARI